MNSAIKEFRSEGINIIIGPISYGDFGEVQKYNDTVFISPSNMNPEFTNNVISVGVSLESQLIALLDFLKKKKKTNTIILFPENKFTDFIEKKTY